MYNKALKTFLVAMILFFCLVNVSHPLKAFDVRTMQGVILNSDGYTNMIETVDGNLWLVDGYDLKPEAMCFVVFETFKTSDITDDEVISIIETN